MIKITKIRAIWRWGLLFFIMLSILLFGCVKKSRLAEIPEYPPTKKFLENQAEVKRRAQAILEYNERERRTNLVKGQEINYSKWEPIYRRIVEARTHQYPQQ